MLPKPHRPGARKVWRRLARHVPRLPRRRAGAVRTGRQWANGPDSLGRRAQGPRAGSKAPAQRGRATTAPGTPEKSDGARTIRPHEDGRVRRPARRRAQGPPYSPAPHPPRGGPSTAVAAGDSAGRPAKRGRTELAGADRTAGVGSDAKTKTCDKIRCLGPLPIGRTALAPRLRALPGLPHSEGSRPARPAGRGPPSSPCGARRSVCVCVCVCVCVVSARPPDRQEFSHPIPEAHRPPKP